jgi:hypothetical protein
MVGFVHFLSANRPGAQAQGVAPADLELDLSEEANRDRNQDEFILNRAKCNGVCLIGCESDAECIVQGAQACALQLEPARLKLSR